MTRSDAGTEHDDENPPEAPEVAVGDRVTVTHQDNGSPENIEAVVATVHNNRTIDAVYRRESRVEFGGDGSFERDKHNDEYQLATSLVYQADAFGWIAGWDK